MSQSYTQFSQAISCANADQLAWLVAELDKWKEGKCDEVGEDDCAPEYEVRVVPFAMNKNLMADRR